MTAAVVVVVLALVEVWGSARKRIWSRRPGTGAVLSGSWERVAQWCDTFLGNNSSRSTATRSAMETHHAKLRLWLANYETCMKRCDIHKRKSLPDYRR